jgi:hypothetical protein
MDKTMQAAADVAEAEVTETPVEEVTQATEEVQEETSENTQQDQVTTGTEETPSEGESEVTPATTTTDFDPIAFIDSLEVENLTPEQKKQLKDGYLRQADYTKKTQAVASEKKALEEYSTLKPYIEKIFQNEELYKQVFGQPETTTETTEEIPDDPVEYAKYVEQKAVERAKAELREEMKQEQLEVTMENDRIAASQLDPRLNTDIEFAEEIAGIIALDQEFIAGQKTAVEATQQALEKYKIRENRYKSRFTTDLQQRAKSKSMVFPNTRTSSIGSSNAVKAPSSMAEAAEMAEREIS